MVISAGDSHGSLGWDRERRGCPCPPTAPPVLPEHGEREPRASSGCPPRAVPLNAHTSQCCALSDPAPPAPAGRREGVEICIRERTRPCRGHCHPSPSPGVPPLHGGTSPQPAPAPHGEATPGSSFLFLTPPRPLPPLTTSRSAWGDRAHRRLSPPQVLASLRVPREEEEEGEPQGHAAAPRPRVSPMRRAGQTPHPAAPAALTRCAARPPPTARTWSCSR